MLLSFSLLTDDSSLPLSLASCCKMEFWGVAVEAGLSLPVAVSEGKVLHLKQACLYRKEEDDTTESVRLQLTIEGKKFILGTLNCQTLPVYLYEIVFHKGFQLSHSCKKGVVYFYGFFGNQLKVAVCKKCDDRDFQTQDALSAHIKEKHAVEGVNVCKKCDDRDFMTEAAFFAHMRVKHGIHICTTCNRNFKTKAALSAHINEKHVVHICKTCDNRDFQTQAALSAHINEKHRVEGENVCKECDDRNFKTEAALSAHMSAKHGSHICRTCNRNFKTEVGLSAHKQSKHTNK